ncbi:DUF1700 domain-containing protein [Mycoplasmatota bacterium]|nr:DUF1700 domain-containing protein [Mycoplasmatota bacterium]
MNKKQFLRELENELSLLNYNERREIISFYEDRFQNAIFEGKTEEDLINELERPSEIAKNVLNEYGINSGESKKHRIDLLSVFGIIWFDILVSSWLVTVSVVVPLSLAASWFSYIWVFTVFKYYSFFPALLRFIGVSAGYVIYFFVIILLMELGLKIVTRILNWHINVFTGDNYKSLKNKIDNISIFRLFKKLNIPNKVILITIGASLITTFVVAIILFYQEDSSIIIPSGTRSVETHELETDVYIYNISDSFDITGDFEDMKITYEVTDSDKLTVTHSYNYDNEFTIDYSETSKYLNMFDESKKENWLDYINWDFSINSNYLVQELHIEVPSNVSLNELDLSSVSDPITISDYIGDTLDIDSVSSAISIISSEFTNGSADNVSGEIIINGVATKDLVINSISGNVELNTISSQENSRIDIDSVSGNVSLLELYANEVSIETISGDVSLSNVYVSGMDIQTVSGNADYYNTDTSFVLDDLNFDSISGKFNHSVPNKQN